MSLDLSELRRLGMDEISLRKGQGDYVVVLVDLDKNELVGLVESRQHKDIKEVLKSWGGMSFLARSKKSVLTYLGIIEDSLERFYRRPTLWQIGFMLCSW